MVVIDKKISKVLLQDFRDTELMYMSELKAGRVSEISPELSLLPARHDKHRVLLPSCAFQVKSQPLLPSQDVPVRPTATKK